MKIALFSARTYDEHYFNANNHNNYIFTFFKASLSNDTVALANGYDAICVFPNDDLNASVIEALHSYGIKIIALRCAGFNNVDLDAAKKFNLIVVRVPEYSPEAVAEHAVALLLTLNRKLHKAYNRVREGNFSLQGLMGYNLHGKTVGVIGTGHIGLAFCRIVKGFGCHIVAFDPVPSSEAQAMGVKYVTFNELIKQSNIVSLHCPLNPETYHLINDQVLREARHGFSLINTSRGGLIDTKAIIHHLKKGNVRALALDVYEQESGLFFEDLSDTIIQDDTFQRLMTFPNVLITGHQGFFTHEAMTEIVHTTMNNLECAANDKLSGNEL